MQTKPKRNKHIFSKVLRITAVACMLITSVLSSEIQAGASMETKTEIGAKTTGEGDHTFNYFPNTKWKAGPNAEEYFTTVNTTLPENQDVYYTFDFTGTGAEIWGFKAPRHSIIKYSIDGNEADAKEVDTFETSRTPNAVKLFEFKNLENGKHTIKVAASGKKNASAIAGDIQVSKAIVYAPAPVATDVVFEQQTINMYAGKTFQITYKTTPEIANLSDDFVYASGDESIATVSKDGLITAHKEGTTTISGTSTSASLYPSVDVIVKPTDDMHATIVDSGDSYQQKDYNNVLSQSIDKESLWSWKGEKATSQIAILSNDKELEGVSVTASDFTNGNNVIAASNINPSFMKETKAFIGNAGWYAQVSIDTPNNPDRLPAGPKEDFFDAIYTKEPINIQPNKLQLVWVDVNVPNNAASGIYKGTLSVRAKNSKDVKTIDYTLEVINANKPAVSDYTFRPDFWTYPFSTAEYYNVEPFGDEHVKILKEHLLKYKESGGTTLTGSIVDEAWGGQTFGKGDPKVPSLIKWKKNANGTWVFDYTYFDTFVEVGKSIGLGDNFVMYSPIPWNDRIRYYDEATKTYKTITASTSNKDNYRNAWKPFFVDFAKHLDEKGWFSDVSFGFDERPNMKTVFDVIDEVTNKDGKKFRKQGAYNHIYNADGQAVTPRMENLSFNLDQLRNDVPKFKKWLKERKAAGLKTTFYTGTEIFPNTFIKSKPVEGYWTMAYSGALELDGFLDWAYDSWVRNPLEDATHSAFQPGDTFMVYPSESNAANKVTLPSIRSEKYEEGVRDINKLYYMKKQQPALAADIDALFANVKSNYAFKTVNNQPGWVPNSTTNGRPAKWITEDSKQAMLSDMKTFKDGIKEISKKFALLQAPDKANLQELYDEYSKIEATLYTVSSYADMKKALQDATAILSSDEVTDIQISEGIAQLQAAKDKLLMRVSEDNFKMLQDSFNKINERNFASQKDLLNKAKALIEKGAEDITKEDADSMLILLQEALQPVHITAIGDTNIEVNGIFDPAAQLHVENMTEKEIAKLMATIKDKEYLASMNVLKMYNIELKLDDTNIQPIGNVKIKIPLTDTEKKAKVSILYVNDEGHMKELPSTIENGKIIFETNHFSWYGIVEKKEGNSNPFPENPNLDIPNQNHPNIPNYDNNTLLDTKVDNTSKPLTGDTANTSILILSGSASLGLLIFLIRKRRKQSIQ